MKGLLRMIFKPHDGSRRQVQDEVVESRQQVQRAASRFEETIRELLDRNDTLTGRKPNHAQTAFRK